MQILGYGILYRNLDLGSEGLSRLVFKNSHVRFLINIVSKNDLNLIADKIRRCHYESVSR